MNRLITTVSFLAKEADNPLRIRNWHSLRKIQPTDCLKRPRTLCGALWLVLVFTVVTLRYRADGQKIT